MMKQCIQCIFYNKEDDELNRGCEDCLFENPSDPRNGEHHYCAMYHELYYGIPYPIMNDEEKCQHLFSREEAERVSARIKRNGQNQN